MKGLKFLIVLLLMSSFGYGNGFAQPRLKRICTSKTGQNTVYWFPYKSPCQAFLNMYIYARENNFSSFKLIDSVSNPNQLTYDHNSTSFQRGSYFLIYRALCNGEVVDFISDTLLVDVEAPKIVDPDSVSVGADGEIFIGWKRSPSADAKSYVIYRMVGNNNFPVDTVFGRENTFYLDAQHGDANSNPEKFRIAAIDSCDNIAPIGSHHETMLISGKQDYCGRTVTLSWTAYVGWQEGILRYDIYASTQKYFGYNKIATVQNANTVTINNLPNHTSYYFFVRAVRNTSEVITSSSNRILLTTDFDDQLHYIYLNNVSFLTDASSFTGSNKIEIQWHVSNAANMKYFEVWRGKGPASTRMIAMVPANGAANYFYIDADMREPEVFYYYVTAYSNCGNYAGKSNTSNSIVAKLAMSENTRTLNWNSYKSWNADVQSYSVNRRYVSHKANINEVITLSPFTFSFNDFDSIVSESSPGICYFIEAEENDGNAFGFKARSLSNVVCYTEKPYVHVPNAFFPDGLYNTIFKPVYLNVDTLKSGITIYNRWGQKVLDNGSVVKGWDGKNSSGRKEPEGVYMYLINIQGTDGSFKVYKGTVTLL